MPNLHETTPLSLGAAVSRAAVRTQGVSSLVRALGWAAVLMLFAAPVSAGTEAPVVSAWANAPGWITVNWTHSGVDVYWYEIQRQDLSWVWKDYGASGTLTDANLQPNTSYHYRVCAIYDFDQACSDWVSATTLPSASEPAPSEPEPPRAPSIYPPEITASSNHALFIVVHWGSDQAYQLHDVVLYRNNEVVFDAQDYGDFIPEFNDLVPRANREYTYQVCFISLSNETACSEPLLAMPQATPPTAPVAVTGQRIHNVRAGSSGVSDHLTAGSVLPTTTADITWQNGVIPGHFISVERQDTFLLPGGSTSTTLRPTRATLGWVELQRIDAMPDPSEMVFEFGKQPLAGSQPGTTYRVCAIEPRLGDAGSVCSEPVTLR